MSDISLIQSIWTVVVMVLFVGIVLWAYSGKRRADFEKMGNIPFEEDQAPGIPESSKEKNNG